MSVLETALAHPRSSVRLQAVMDAGTRADLADLDVLVARCAVEPDLFVRDMLSWALARLPADVVVPRLLDELRRDDPRARSQALHTLSKIGDRSVYPSVVEHVGDVDPGVGRTAWRAAVALVPDDRRAELATRLGEQLGHGDAETRLALSRSIVALGADVAAPVLAHARESRFDAVREHAAEIERILRDPDAASELAVRAARRQVALGRTRDAKG